MNEEHPLFCESYPRVASKASKLRVYPQELRSRPHARTKLTKEQQAVIRDAYNLFKVNQVQLASGLGISRKQVQRVLSNWEDTESRQTP